MDMISRLLENRARGGEAQRAEAPARHQVRFTYRVFMYQNACLCTKMHVYVPKCIIPGVYPGIISPKTWSSSFFFKYRGFI